jgi:hypothetical protein
MKHLFTTALVTAAFALPLAAAAQERYPTLNPDQLTPAQKAYVDGLQKPPRNNTTALKNPPFKVYMRSPDLASKLEAVSDYVRWNTGQPPRLTELAIMITARQWSNQWIWRGHYQAGVKGGLDPSVGADIAAGRRPENMKEDDPLQLRDRNVSRQSGVRRDLRRGGQGLRREGSDRSRRHHGLLRHGGNDADHRQGGRAQRRRRPTARSAAEVIARTPLPARGYRDSHTQ